MPEPAPAKKVLVIDDVAELRELARSILEEEGYLVDVAPDATLGGLKLLSNRPDLVILDLVMPGVDGFKFVEYVKTVTTPPAIIILSGSRNVETVLRGVGLGVFAFLSKPVNFTTLVSTCRAALEKPPPAPAPQRPKPAEDRRAHTRHTVLVQVQVETAGRGLVLGEMTDLSAGGARVISVVQFPVGARLQLMADPKLLSVAKNLVAEVRSSEPVDTGFRHGLQFVDLDPEVERLLRQHLEPK